MKRLLILTIGLLVVAIGLSFINVQAAPSMEGNLPTMAPTYTSSPTTDSLLAAQVTMVFANATNTQISIAKTEQAIRDGQETQIESQRLDVLAKTQAASGTAAMSTQIATQTHGMETQQATQTQGAAMVGVMGTQTAGVGATATQKYWNDVTLTPLAATQQLEEIRFRTAQMGIWFFPVFGFLIGLLLLAWLSVKVWHSWKLAQAEYLQASKLEYDQNGRLPVPNTDALGKGNKLVNPNLAHRATLDPGADDLTPEQALMNTAMHLQLEATRAIAQSPALMRRLTKPGVAAETRPGADVEISQPDSAPPFAGLLTSNATPAFALLDRWDGKGIPYGMSATGLESVNLSLIPHGGIFGQTGSGKSRYFLRTFIAGALASGQRVIILGKTVDYLPFMDHPNVTMIPIRRITEQAEANKYAGYLKRIVDEMNRRDEVLTLAKVSTWELYGRENTVLVLDEYGNALDMMPAEHRSDSIRWVSGLAKEGRKAGFNIWLATQRAVGLKGIIEQLGRAVFYLADPEASRIALGMPGAEELPHGHFFSRFGTSRVLRCSAFDPTDQEITSFLQQRDIKPLEPIDWIDAEVTDMPEEKKPDIDQQIIALYLKQKELGNVSLSEIQRKVFGDINTGGAHFRQIQDILARLNAATNPATTGNRPQNGPVAA